MRPKLKDILYYRTGGDCLEFCQPESAAELAELIKRFVRDGIKYIPVGGGTNTLFTDEYFDGAVIAFSKMQGLTFESDWVRVGAGVENTFFSESCYSSGFSGVGWMNRLPGQIGGTVRMNARCYGGEISQVVTEVVVVSKTGEIKTYKNAKEMFKGYKDTIFMTNGDLITEARLKLGRGDMALVRKKMDFCASDRTAKGQFTYPSCGCVFKNSYVVGVSSGILLEEAGVKELAVGGAAVNPAHANFVFNKSASSGDILELSLLMREAVWKRFGVWMEYEMEILGILPEVYRQRIEEIRPAKPNDSLLEPLRLRMKAHQEVIRPAPEGLNSV